MSMIKFEFKFLEKLLFYHLSQHIHMSSKKKVEGMLFSIHLSVEKAGLIASGPQEQTKSDKDLQCDYYGN